MILTHLLSEGRCKNLRTHQLSQRMANIMLEISSIVKHGENAKVRLNKAINIKEAISAYTENVKVS